MVRERLKKWGGSLGVVIDAAEVRKRGLQEGMEIEFDPKPTTLLASDLTGLFYGRITKAELARMLRALETDDGWRD